ncbi:MAG: NADH-quinone oxidoreductase subunit M [Deltaproteobacteria bacterium]|nr:NADH-quinone oxidoreductase subunit M [Deltaproteobacteria bacterium]
MGILTTLLVVPVIGAITVAVLGKLFDDQTPARLAGLWFAAAEFVLSLYLWWAFSPAAAGMQFVESYHWIEPYGIKYLVGIDGLSLLLVILTTFLVPLILLSAWSAVDRRPAGYFASMLLLEAGMLGAFFAQDIFLFYVFWEVMLVPMYLLIGIWGGERRLYAAVKFFLYTMAGSVLMLLAILATVYLYYQSAGKVTFELAALAGQQLPLSTQRWLFAAYALAFAIKVPIFPLHTWLPDAHVEAPTGGSVILAGILLKLGTYGFLRYAMPLYPAAALEAAPYFMALAVAGIIYGALVALVQPDIKKLVAYSSVSHLGFVVLGIFAFTEAATSGAIYQMLNHGISTGMLFFLVGVVYERRHTRLIRDYGGLAKVIPVYSFLLIVATMASVGLPGTNGFVGEFSILYGTFISRMAGAKAATALAATGVILGAVYMLWMVQRVLYGPVTSVENQKLKDVNGRELAYLVPLAILIVLMGVYPKPFMNTFKNASREHLARFSKVSVLATLPASDLDGREIITARFAADDDAAGRTQVALQQETGGRP